MAKKSTFQIAAEYYVARTFLSVLKSLPRRWAVAVGVGIGYIAYFCLGKLRRIGMRNTQLAFPEASEERRKQLVLGCFKSLGRQLGEASQFPKATKESLFDMYEHEDTEEEWIQYQQARAAHRGIILLAPHLGGWEILAFAASVVLEPGSYVARRLDNPRIEAMAEELRGRFGNRSIDKSNAALPSLQVLRQGGVLGILADFNSQPQEGVFVPFFGHLACTTAGVAALAMRTNALTILAFGPWDETKKKYLLRIGPAIEFENTGDRRRDIETFTARFTALFEKAVREYPEQWLWIHKRWHTRPEGEANFYE